MRRGFALTLGTALVPVAALTALGSCAPLTVSASGNTSAPAEAASAQIEATVFDVGDRQPYPTLASVPWDQLMPGAEVRIHYRAAPYREKIRVSQSGTAEAPIRIIGVRGPQGARPVIDGTNATTPEGMTYPFAVTQDRGLIVITRRPGQAPDYKPSHIEISGLTLTGAWRDSDAAPRTFTAGDGSRREYTFNAAGLFVERGDYITISDNEFTNNGNGLFVASGANESLISRHIRVLNNLVHGNGNVGRNTQHNAYCEAIDILYEGNTFGDLRPGATGTGLKDRSAGMVARNNHFAGGSIMLDLVDADGSWPVLTREPSYRTTIVERNTFENIHDPAAPARDGVQIVHYGGDTGVSSHYRKHTLYFRHNTVTITANQVDRHRTILLKAQTDEEVMEMEGNKVTVLPFTEGQPKTNLSLMEAKGRLIVVGTENQVSTGWTPFRDGVAISGLIDGVYRIVTMP